LGSQIFGIAEASHARQPNYCLAPYSTFGHLLHPHHSTTKPYTVVESFGNITCNHTQPALPYERQQPWHQESGVRHIRSRCAQSKMVMQRLGAYTVTDDEDEGSTPPTSPQVAPIARRSKFDDEEDDDDVRQPTMPRARMAQAPPYTNKRTDYRHNRC
jgi:hypothetical protein